MDNLTKIVDNIQEKVGKETAGIIADDLANILVIEEANEKNIKQKDETIEKYKKDKEMLIQANGNLLLQVPQTKEEIQEDKKEVNEPFDFRTVFENGKFKR